MIGMRFMKRLKFQTIYSMKRKLNYFLRLNDEMYLYILLTIFVLYGSMSGIFCYLIINLIKRFSFNKSL